MLFEYCHGGEEGSKRRADKSAKDLLSLIQLLLKNRITIARDN